MCLPDCPSYGNASQVHETLAVVLLNLVLPTVTHLPWYIGSFTVYLPYLIPEHTSHWCLSFSPSPFSMFWCYFVFLGHCLSFIFCSLRPKYMHPFLTVYGQFQAWGGLWYKLTCGPRVGVCMEHKSRTKISLAGLRTSDLSLGSLPRNR